MSELFQSVFGERGAHARSAFGVAQIPLGCCVEIDLVCELATRPAMIHTLDTRLVLRPNGVVSSDPVPAWDRRSPGVSAPHFCHRTVV